MIFDPRTFTSTQSKPLPVVLLLDVSGSMGGAKINALNKAVAEMIKEFAKEESREIEITVAIITFGERVNVHTPYTSASKIVWQGLSAGGMTPMGTAFKRAKDMIEDKNVTPSRAYRPTIVLVSDGQPTDSWEQPVDAFANSGRSSKCDRMAMAIGSDADHNVLKRFTQGTQNEVFHAEDADKIHAFFKYVTMSVTVRTKSTNPNVIPNPEDLRIDDSTSNTTGSNNTSDPDNDIW